MQVSRQSHPGHPGCFTHGERTPVMIVQGAVGATEPVEMFWRRQNSHAYAGIQNPDLPAHILVTTLTGPICISVQSYKEEIYD